MINATMSYNSTEQREFNTCRRCGGRAFLHHLGKHQYLACDSCQTFSLVGGNLFTPYEELIHSGALDDVIGGAENRNLAIVENDLETTRVLEKYREVA